MNSDHDPHNFLEIISIPSFMPQRASNPILTVEIQSLSVGARQCEMYKSME